MTPEDLAKTGTESGHQRAVFCWAALNAHTYPELEWLHHIPNGGSRGDCAKSRAIAGGAMKAEGVKPGVFDLFLPVARHNLHGLYIEMKAPGKINQTSDQQKKFALFLTKQKYAWVVCDDWQMAVKMIVSYLTD